MLFPFLIMFREGIEAALIVGIIASYLRQSGRTDLMRSIWLGVALASLLCLVVGIILQVSSQDFPQRQQELFASVIAIVAVGMLTWMVFLLATFQQGLGIQAPMGALFGYVAAIAVGVGIYQGGIRINLRKFFKWTGAFIILVAAGLLAGAFCKAHEAGLWNLFQDVVYDFSSWLPEHGPIGTILAGILNYHDAPTVTEVFVYWMYLIPTFILFFRGGSVQRPQVQSQQES
jgi:high-affinity iron transporter